mmetsp:Transcript_5644/g.14420  ORF Transcript_5644/g.14420 Transcript_5644/m.14420 type:complete len:213 (+) Transcript_5644:150-788(+)
MAIRSFSLSFAGGSQNGSSMSFLMTLFTESLVTTVPLVRSTTSSAPVASALCVMGHTYRSFGFNASSVADGSPSLSAGVNLTEMSCLSRSGSPLIGQRIVVSGFATRLAAIGAFCGVQKLRSAACLLTSSLTTWPRTLDVAPAGLQFVRARDPATPPTPALARPFCPRSNASIARCSSSRRASSALATSAASCAAHACNARSLSLRFCNMYS